MKTPRQTSKDGQAVILWWDDDPPFYAAYGHLGHTEAAAAILREYRRVEGLVAALRGARLEHGHARWANAGESLRCHGVERQLCADQTPGPGAFAVTILHLAAKRAGGVEA